MRMLFVLLFLLSVSVVSGLSSEFYVDDTDLPLNFSTVLEFNLAENYTVFLSRVDSEPLLEVEYPNASIVGSNGSVLIVFEVSVLDYDPLFDDVLTAEFLITNDANSNKVSYKLEVYVNSSIEVIEESSNFTVFLLNDEFVVEITTNLLPKKGVLPVELLGVPFGIANVSCTGWLSCPSSIVFPQDGNKTILNVNYTIPLNAPLGNTTYSFTVNTTNVTRTQNVVFRVKEPGLDLISYTWNDDCFKPIGNQLFLDYDKCWKAYEEFQIKRLSQIIQRARMSADETLESFCPDPEVITEFVVTGDIAEESYRELRLLREQNVELTESNSRSSRMVAILTESLDECRGKTIDNSTAVLASAFSEAVRIQREAEEYERAQRALGYRNFWIGFGIVVSVLLLVGMILSARRRKWEGW
jgi:hypothetical protein